MDSKIYFDNFKINKRLLSFTYDCLFIIMGVFLLAVSSRIIIPLVFTPIPVTLQTFSVLVISMLYGKKLSFITIFSYLIIGALGFPVFQNGNSGMVYLISGPTLGYNIGFLFSAYTIGVLAENGYYNKTSYAALYYMLIGNLIIYIFGLTWLSKFIEIKKLLQCGFFPFIIGDVFKIFLSTLLVQKFYKK